MTRAATKPKTLQDAIRGALKSERDPVVRAWLQALLRGEKRK